MSRIGTKIAGLLAVGAAGGVLLMTSPACAADLTLLSDGMNTNYAAHINGPGGSSEYAYIGPVTFQALDADNNPFSFTGFCVDIFHNIGLGPLGLAYHDGVLATNNSDTPTFLGGLQLNEISGLINFAATLDGATTLGAEQLAGIQGAIWEIGNPTYHVVADQSAVQGYITSFEAAAPHLEPGSIHTVFSNDLSTQAFAYAGGVPEPASWAMMIIGLGGIGATLRRRTATAFA
jgi:PEP-CTERM motif-containing protein